MATGSRGRAGSILILIYMWRGLRVCGGRFLARQRHFGRSNGSLTRPEVGPNVVREEGKHLVRYLPLRLREALLDETVDGDGKQPDARLQREMQLIEDRLTLLQECGHLGHEVINNALQLSGVCQRVVSGRHILQLDQPLDVRHAERGDFLPERADVMQAIDADRVAPATASFGVTQNAGTIPAVVRVRHQPALQVTAGHHRSQRSVREVERDHLGCLIGGTVDEIRREGLGVGALIGRSEMALLHAARRPQRDRLRPGTGSPARKQFLEVGAHRSVRHAQSLRDLLVGEPVRGKRQDLRLPRRQAAGAEVGAVPTVRVTAGESWHRFITRCVENNSGTLSYAYQLPYQYLGDMS